MRPSEPSIHSPAASIPARRPPVLALIAISALSPFAINAIVPSMPAIERAFSADYGRVQLVLSLFLASVAGAQIFIGPLSDRFGRRPVLLIGFTLFVAASLTAPFSRNVDTLIGLRVIQGATGCVGIVLGRAIVRDLYDRSQAASMLGYVTMGLAMAPMVAPLVGGVFQELFGWTAIFWFMAGFGAVCLAVTVTAIPETNLRPTSEISFRSLFADYSRLLGSPDFLLFTASSSLSGGAFFAFLGGAPYVAERLMNLAPSIYGLWFGLIAIGYASGSFITGRFTHRVGVARMIMAGSILALVSVTLPPLFLSLGYSGPLALFLPMMMIGVANGMSLPSAVSGAVSVRPEIAGAASGLSGATQIGTGAVLSAVGAAVLAGGTSALPLFVLMMITTGLAILVAVGILIRDRRAA